MARGGRTKYDQELLALKIVELKKAGLGDGVIAKQLKCNRKTVYNYLNKRNKFVSNIEVEDGKPALPSPKPSILPVPPLPKQDDKEAFRRITYTTYAGALVYLQSFVRSPIDYASAGACAKAKIMLDIVKDFRKD